jgi:hypothetical protein
VRRDDGVFRTSMGRFMAPLCPIRPPAVTRSAGGFLGRRPSVMLPPCTCVEQTPRARSSRPSTPYSRRVAVAGRRVDHRRAVGRIGRQRPGGPPPNRFQLETSLEAAFGDAGAFTGARPRHRGRLAQRRSTGARGAGRGACCRRFGLDGGTALRCGAHPLRCTKGSADGHPAGRFALRRRPQQLLGETRVHARRVRCPQGWPLEYRPLDAPAPGPQSRVGSRSLCGRDGQRSPPTAAACRRSVSRSAGSRVRGRRSHTRWPTRT